MWWLFSSLFFLMLLNCRTMNIYYSYKTKRTIFLKACNAIFTYRISFKVTKEKRFIYKSFRRFISETLSNLFSTMSTGEDLDNQKGKWLGRGWGWGRFPIERKGHRTTAHCARTACLSRANVAPPVDLSPWSSNPTRWSLSYLFWRQRIWNPASYQGHTARKWWSWGYVQLGIAQCILCPLLPKGSLRFVPCWRSPENGTPFPCWPCFFSPSCHICAWKKERNPGSTQYWPPSLENARRWTSRLGNEIISKVRDSQDCPALPSWAPLPLPGSGGPGRVFCPYTTHSRTQAHLPPYSILQTSVHKDPKSILISSPNSGIQPLTQWLPRRPPTAPL